MTLDVRSDFPVTETCLKSPVTGETMPLIYLDHAASTHAPTPVLRAHERFLREAYANVHRGAHHLSIVSTEAYEDARWKCKAFVGAGPEQDVMFGQNTTEVLNMAAHLMGDVPGMTLVTMMEHHSNDLPHRARGPVAHVAVDREGQVDVGDLREKLARYKVKLVACSAASNVTGIRPPLAEIIDLAHEYGARVLVDGAQALAHLPLDLTKMGETGGADFFAAAGHKAYAPFGAAFLVAPKEVIDVAPPFRPGGGTVQLVGTDEVLWSTGFERHEGGTPNVSGVVAMGAALNYLRGLGLARVREHEVELLETLIEGLRAIPGVTVYGRAPVDERVGAVSFNVEGVHHGLVAKVLDNEFGIATRNGCFCAHPYLISLLGIGEDIDSHREHLRAGGSSREPDFPGAVRASLGVYNNEADVAAFLDAMRAVARCAWQGSYAWSLAEDWHLEKAPAA